jgi:hypothetical protein
VPHRPVAAGASKAWDTASCPSRGVDLATIAAAAGGRPDPSDEVCNRSDDGKPPLELSERTEQILASRDWLSPMKSAS